MQRLQRLKSANAAKGLQPLEKWRKMAITWAELVEIEPKLGELLIKIRQVRANSDRFCANDVWYGRSKYPNFREQMYHLVGWEARQADDRLTTSEAFDVAYRRLYDALPACRNCACI